MTGIVGGLAETVKGFGESGAALENLSKHTGYAARDLDRFMGVASAVGTTSETVANALESLSEKFNLLNAPSRGPLFADLMRTPGAQQTANRLLQIEQGPGSVEHKRNEETLEYIELLRRVREARGEAYARGIAAQTGGNPDLVNLTRVSAEQLKKMMDQVERTRGSFNPEAIERYEAAMSWLSNSLTGFQRAVGSGLVNDFSRLVETSSKFITDNRAEITGGIFGAVKELKNDLRTAADLLQPLADKFNELQNRGHETERSGEGVVANVPKWLAEQGFQKASDILAGDRSYGDTTSHLTATGGLPTTSPDQDIPDIGKLLKPI